MTREEKQQLAKKFTPKIALTDKERYRYAFKMCTDSTKEDKKDDDDDGEKCLENKGFPVKDSKTFVIPRPKLQGSKNAYVSLSDKKEDDAVVVKVFAFILFFVLICFFVFFLQNLTLFN